MKKQIFNPEQPAVEKKVLMPQEMLWVKGGLNMHREAIDPPM
jgi:hypothetical protein